MDQVQSRQIQLKPLQTFKSDRKSVSEGGFGGAPGFPILSDRDLSFSASCGVARWVINQDHSNPCSSKGQLLHCIVLSFCRECGSPARATLIVDWSGNLRYMAAHRTDIPRSLMLPFSSMQSSPVHLSICYLQFFYFKECDRDPQAGAGFPAL